MGKRWKFCFSFMDADALRARGGLFLFLMDVYALWARGGALFFYMDVDALLAVIERFLSVGHKHP